MKNKLERTIDNGYGAFYSQFTDNEADYTLVFLHGNSSSSRFWDPLIASRLNQNFNMLVWDLPGHGNSPRASDPRLAYSLRNYADLLVTLIKAYQLKHFYLIGHSLGGHIILETPEILKASQGAVIMGTPPLGFPPRLDLAFQMSPQFLVLLQDNNDRATLEANFQTMVSPKKADLAQILLEDYLHTDPTARIWLAKNLQSGESIDELEVFRNFKEKITLVKAEKDPMINPAYFSQHLPEDLITEIPGAGHYAPLEFPESFIELIGRQYLDKIL
jgi:pimeloyl-ACP methyl ester carboxylesterase